MEVLCVVFGSLSNVNCDCIKPFKDTEIKHGPVYRLVKLELHLSVLFFQTVFFVFK